MKKIARRDFLKNTGGLIAFAVTASAFEINKTKPLLSFSTLGCPDWSFEKIVNFAADNHYQGLEIRTIQRQMDLTKCAEFSSSEKISETLKFVKDKGLKIINLGASTNLHIIDAAERKKNLDEAKQFIDL